MSKSSTKKVKKIKNKQPKTKPDVPGVSRVPDCDKPKESASQLRKNIKQRNVNQNE